MVSLLEPVNVDLKTQFSYCKVDIRVYKDNFIDILK